MTSAPGDWQVRTCKLGDGGDDLRAHGPLQQLIVSGA
jgi:hypothetical protein